MGAGGGSKCSLQLFTLSAQGRGSKCRFILKLKVESLEMTANRVSMTLSSPNWIEVPIGVIKFSRKKF